MAKERSDIQLNFDLFTEADCAHLLAAAQKNVALPADPEQAQGSLAVSPTSPDDLVRMLNGLLLTCHDGVYGFTDGAEHAQSESVRALMLRQAEECRMAALELRAQVKSANGEPEEGGTASGALHRGWLTVRGTLTGFTDEALLEECEREQDRLLLAYREILRMQCPADLVAVLLELQRHALRSHEQVRMARDAERMRAHAPADAH